MQVHKLNEDFFAEQQKRNELISQERTEVSREYEEQLDRLRNSYEGEIDKRK